MNEVRVAHVVHPGGKTSNRETHDPRVEQRTKIAAEKALDPLVGLAKKVARERTLMFGIVRSLAIESRRVGGLVGVDKSCLAELGIHLDRDQNVPRVGIGARPRVVQGVGLIAEQEVGLAALQRIGFAGPKTEAFPDPAETKLRADHGRLPEVQNL